MGDVKKFPGFRWSPTGEHRVFNSAEDVPEGWIDCHPDDPKAPAREMPPKAPLSRQQIVAELGRRGVAFQRNAATKALYDLLVAEVERSEA